MVVDAAPESLKVNYKESVHYLDEDDNDWLGYGAYGTVRKAQLKNKDHEKTQTVAVKKWNNVSVESKIAFQREVHHLAALDHVNIVKMLGFDDTAFVILLEYAENGSLYDLLHSVEHDAALRPTAAAVYRKLTELVPMFPDGNI
ncbi:unnamed protein product, partial [Sphagnum balticum]